MAQMRLLSIVVLIAVSILVVGAELCFAEFGNATLVGRITFHGAIPPPLQHKVNQDSEVCGKTVTVQPLIVHQSTDGLRDAVVSIEGIKEPGLRTVDKMVIVTNKDCAFKPRIQAVTVGQMLDLRNDDLVLHNTHIRKKTNFIKCCSGGRWKRYYSTCQ